MNQFFGNIFGEEISSIPIKRSGRTHGFEPESGTGETRNPWIFIVIFLLGFALLSARLYDVTIIQGARLRQLSVENRIREEKVDAPRGIIYDRNGQKLVRNIPVFSDSKGNQYFESPPEGTNSTPLTESVTRQYIYSDLYAHILGYVGEVSSSEIDTQNANSLNTVYYPGDVIGKMGVEKKYDTILRGIDGKQLQEVDATGKVVRVLGQIEPISGKSINLTVDTDLQRVAAQSLSGQKGAIIVTVPETGEILSLYSSPSFDPNAFVRGENTSPILSSTDNPLFNRAIAGKYPPGSTFKIVVALAALESGAITKDTQIEDTGILNIGTFSFGNWYYLQYGKKEGFLDIVGAIRRSNDIFFYKAGEQTGITRLAAMAKKMGVGVPIGIDIPGEDVGLMPDPKWRKQELGTEWYTGDTYHVSIGQGDLLTTPLEVNAWTNIIANDGKLCVPHVLQQTGSKNRTGNSCKYLDLKQEDIDLIKEGMKGACATGGTGWPFFNFQIPEASGSANPKISVDGVDFFDAQISSGSAVKNGISIPVACKTGTAEFGDKNSRTHAWFTVFAPVNHPQISVTVLVEGAGEGSNIAAPIAKKILETWFMKKN